MTYTLSAEIESRLQEVADREGADLNILINEAILSSLEWDEQERAAIIADVLRGDEDIAAGRVKSLAQFIEEKRAKFGFPANWPHDVNIEDTDADC